MAFAWTAHRSISIEKYAQYTVGQFVRRGSRLWMGEGGVWTSLFSDAFCMRMDFICMTLALYAGNLPKRDQKEPQWRTYFLCIGKLWKIAARVKLSLVGERQSSMAGSTQSWDSQVAALAISISLGGISRTLWQLEVLEWHRQIMPNKRKASSKIDMTTINIYKPQESNQHFCGLQSFLAWHGLPAVALQPEGKPLTPNQERLPSTKQGSSESQRPRIESRPSAYLRFRMI